MRLPQARLEMFPKTEPPLHLLHQFGRQEIEGAGEFHDGGERGLALPQFDIGDGAALQIGQGRKLPLREIACGASLADNLAEDFLRIRNLPGVTRL